MKKVSMFLFTVLFVALASTVMADDFGYAFPQGSGTASSPAKQAPVKPAPAVTNGANDAPRLPAGSVVVAMAAPPTETPQMQSINRQICSLKRAKRGATPSLMALINRKIAGLQSAYDELRKDVKVLKKEVKWVKANPIGGAEGQGKMWTLLKDAGVVSQSHMKVYVAKHYVGKIEYNQDIIAVAKGMAELSNRLVEVEKKTGIKPPAEVGVTCLPEGQPQAGTQPVPTPELQPAQPPATVKPKVAEKTKDSKHKKPKEAKPATKKHAQPISPLFWLFILVVIMFLLGALCKNRKWLWWK